MVTGQVRLSGQHREMAKLVLIGYWRSEHTPDWPDPRVFIDASWDVDERSAVADYLFAGTLLRAYLGYSSCRICGQQNGNLEYTDGRFAWPEGLAHYVDVHGVRLPGSVIEHISSRHQRLHADDLERDEDWWRTVQPGQ
jgi:hypothetical protein